MSGDRQPARPQRSELDRRGFLRAASITAAVGGSVMLDPVGFAFADDADEQTRVVEGRIEAAAPDWVYVPVQVPTGTTEIEVHYSYDRPTPPQGLPGNALDIGIFDVDGHELGDSRGFRGWSGGARTSFTISRSQATPGYVPGPIVRGTWHIILGPYTVAPQGLNYRLEITLRRGRPGRDFVPSPAPERAAGRGRAWYRGDIHLHTVHSDGRWEPAALAAAVRAAGLDFMFSTEHNTHTASGVWGHHAGDDLLIVDGEEITTRNGHYLAAGLPAGTWIDWRYRAADAVFPRFLDEIHGHGGLAIAAHPFCPYVGCSWKFGFAGIDAVEVWNGPWTPDDEISLSQWDATLVERVADGGRWLPAVGSSDSHNDTQTVGNGQTVVLADDLTRAAVLDAIRAGRAYIAESAQVGLEFGATAGSATAGIGERLDAAPGAEVTVDLRVTGAPGTTAAFVTDQGTIATLPVPESGELSWTTRPQVSGYVRAEVRRPATTPGLPGRMVAFTNPVFLGSLD
ncbi:CehA/McbA family metallohydrolase [Allonocardiopsis opalescens]|uniref:Secreted protein n=1 Tax=Allonocardiopsis opalescens TaxID=1144618 RepID=A0A2T0Q1Z3_9ACTN|nr:CehA/McbA family metallohydrolase [Allonocardiopsis opalescens]PRX97815.1 hypothetical protein CLV72_105165 [Allonocardiopsis opalescens]